MGRGHSGRRSRLRPADRLLEQGRHLLQLGLLWCGQRIAAAEHLRDHPRNLSDVIRRYVVQQPGDGGHRGVLVEPHEQSLATHEVAEGLHVEVVAQLGAHQLFCVAKMPRVGLATRGQDEEQCPDGCFHQPTAVNVSFEVGQFLHQILAVLGRLAGMGPRR